MEPFPVLVSIIPLAPCMTRTHTVAFYFSSAPFYFVFMILSLSTGLLP